MYLNTRIFPTTGYTRVLVFMFIRQELGGTGTGCLFQFTYCGYEAPFLYYMAHQLIFLLHTTSLYFCPIQSAYISGQPSWYCMSYISKLPWNLLHFCGSGQK